MINSNGKITYHQQVSYCGKTRCSKCREGKGHGPYWYAYQTINGHTTRTYIGKKLPPDVQAPQEVVPVDRVDMVPVMNISNVSNVAIRIFVLGQFRLERRQQRQWQSVTDVIWQQQRVRALLGYLLCSPGRKVTRMQVLEALWPDSDLETATSNLDRIVYSLRQVLEPGRNREIAQNIENQRTTRSSRSHAQLLRTDGEWLILANQPGIWVDADAFEALVSQAMEMSRSPAVSETDLSQNRERLLREAAALYGGDFLPEERRASWVLARRQSLRHYWVGMLLELADLSITQNATSGVLEILDRLLAVDPANEAAVQRFIYVLAQMKRRGEALRAYHRLADMLQREYKTQPSDETRAFYEAVRQGGDMPAHLGHKFRQAAPATAVTSQPATASAASTESGERERAAPSPTKSAMQGMLTVADLTTAQIGRTHQSPLVGRELELEMLRGMLLGVEQGASLQIASQRRTTGIPLDTQRHPQCVVLLGEAGIGKTRLAEEVSREALRRGWAILWSRVYPQESGIPYHIWTEILRRAVVGAGLMPARVPALRSSAYSLPAPEAPASLKQAQETIERVGQSRAERGRRKRGSDEPDVGLSSQLQPLTALLPELEALFSSVSIPLLSPEQEQLRLWEAIRELLVRTSESTPLLIVLDDMQWADGRSGDLLGYLARHIYGHPILLLVTCRDTELPTQPPHALRTLIAHMQREHTVKTLQVNPLTTEEIRRLVSHLPETMVQHIQEQAAGNPFFAEELARSTPPTLPKTVAAALDHRMNRLSSACRRLLEHAAVLGGSFEFPLIAAMETDSTLLDEDTVLDLLEEALQSGVLTEEGAGTRVTYHFWHPLLVSHLYESVSAVRRSRFHLRAATVLQHMHRGREEEVAAMLTHHLVNGGAEAVQIARFAEMAGDRAYTFSAYAEAQYHYRLTLENLGLTLDNLAGTMGVRTGRFTATPDSHLLNLLELLAECMMIRGHFEEARSLYEYILGLHDPLYISSPYEAQKRALLWGEIAWTWRYTGDNARARACCQRGEQVLREADIIVGPAWARLRLQQGSLYWQEGRYEEARSAARESLALFAQQQNPPTVPSATHILRITRIQRTLKGDPVDLGAAHRLLGALAEAEGRLSEALDHLNTALVIFEQADHKRRIAHVSQDISYVYIKKAQYEPAHAALRCAYSLAERIGDDPLIGVVLSNLGELAAATGKLEDAEIWYRKSLAFAERFHDREYISWWNARLARVLREQERYDEAAKCVKRALSTARAMRNNPRIGTALVALGNLRIAQAQAMPLLPVARKRLLMHARQDVERALLLPGLETETKIKGELALAYVSLLLGEAEACEKITRVIEEAHRCELALIEARARNLLR